MEEKKANEEEKKEEEKKYSHTLAQIKRTKNSQQQPYPCSHQHQWARSA